MSIPAAATGEPPGIGGAAQRPMEFAQAEGDMAAMPRHAARLAFAFQHHQVFDAKLAPA